MRIGYHTVTVLAHHGDEEAAKILALWNKQPVGLAVEVYFQKETGIFINIPKQPRRIHTLRLGPIIGTFPDVSNLAPWA